MKAAKKRCPTCGFSFQHSFAKHVKNCAVRMKDVRQRYPRKANPRP